jgi:hypothetical protein
VPPALGAAWWWWAAAARPSTWRAARAAPGHEVTLLALERRAQLPAQRDEVDEALEEGIALVDGAMLRDVYEGGSGGGGGCSCTASACASSPAPTRPLQVDAGRRAATS